MVRLKPTGKEVRRISPNMSASRQFHEPAEPKPERYTGFLLGNPLRTTKREAQEVFMSVAGFPVRVTVML